MYVVAATSNSARTVLCAHDTHKVRTTSATVFYLLSPQFRLPLLSSALGKFGIQHQLPIQFH